MKIFINGMGRIGRMCAHIISPSLTSHTSPNPTSNIQLVGMNSIGSVSMLAHLLKYDSVSHIHNPQITYGDDWIDFGYGKVPYSQETSLDALNIHGADIMLDCTGIHTNGHTLQSFSTHTPVVISAPGIYVDATIVYGVNEGTLTSNMRIVSNASCTTNCLAPSLKALLHFGIEGGNMTTVHAYTQDQNLLDNTHTKDLRRARAAALNIIPTSTGAAKALQHVIPELKGKIIGSSIRVPTPNVSMIDVTIWVRESVTEESVKKAFHTYAHKYPEVMAIESQPLVSSDFNGNTHSVIIDEPLIQVNDNHIIHYVGWYDNEKGFSSRMINTATCITNLR